MILTNFFLFQTTHPLNFAKYQKYKNEKKVKNGRIKKNRIILKEVKCSFSQEQFETDMVNYILDSMAPLSTVENVYFRKIFDSMYEYICYFACV